MAIKKTVIVDVEGNAIEKMEALETQFKQTENSVDSLTDKLADTGKAGKKAGEGVEEITKNGGAIAILDSLTGGLATKFRDAFEATKLFNFSLKGTRTALIATGIGALVVAVGLLVAYWDDIVDLISGANKQLEIQQGLLEETSELLEGDAKIAEAKEKLLISEGKSIVNIRKERIKIAQVQLNNLKTQVETLKLQLDKEKSVGKELGLWESIWLGAKQAVGIDTTHAIAAKILEQEARENEIQKKIDDAETSALNLETFINDLEADPDGKGDTRVKKDDKPVKETEAQKAERIRKAKEAKDKEIADAKLITDKKAREDKLEAITKEYADRELDILADTDLKKNELAKTRALAEIEDLENNEQLKLNIIAFYAGEATRINKEASDKKKAEDKETTKLSIQQKKDETNFAIQATSQMFGSLANLAEEGSKEQEALAIAATLTSAAVAAIGIWEGYSKLGPWGIAGAIAQSVALAAATIGAIKQIKSASKGGSTSGGGGGTKRPSYSIVGDVNATSGNINANTQAIQNVNDNPQKAYVVSTEVTSQQALDREVENNSNI